MTYNEIIDFLYSRLPVFHHQGKSAYKANLNNILLLSEALGNPHLNLKTIHVAGTNGKGSVSHMLASVLQQSGIRVGLYTSPHLIDFRERIRINGEMIPKNMVIEFVENCQTIIETIQPSFFELVTAMAFHYFSVQKVEIAVIETGLGGRLDSTNIITPLLSVITNISLDHTDILGNTLNEIALEKAGIIKMNVPVVIGETDEQTSDVFIQKAKQLSAPITFADQYYLAKAVSGATTKFRKFCVTSILKNSECQYELDLPGLYQSKNLQTVLSCFDKLKELGLAINPLQMEEGLKNVSKHTGLNGRWQIMQQSPLIIADTGHNEAGIAYNMKQLEEWKGKMLHIVFGMVNDKDIRKVLAILPVHARYYFTKASVMRALDEVELFEIAKNYHLSGKTFPSVNEAIDEVLKCAKNEDVIFIGGSTFIVAEALAYFEC